MPVSSRRSDALGFNSVMDATGASAMPVIDISENLVVDVAVEPNEPPGSPA